MKKFYIVDAHSYIHRAYHALPPLTTSKGEMVNAVYGFLRMLMKIEKTENPDYFAVCFDHPSPTFRHLKDDRYKAQRKEMDTELKSQMPLSREVARALNITMFDKPGFEADDVIATLARQGEKNGLDVVVVTGDKDAFQLVNDHIKIMNEQKKILFDSVKVEEKYGLKPNQLVDMFALMGDASDNVPGIKGIGEVTAVKLIQKYGNIENLIKNSDELTGKLKDLVKKGAQEAVNSKYLVTLDDNVPLDFNWEDCKAKEPDLKILSVFLERMEFHSMLNDILGKKNSEQAVREEQRGDPQSVTQPAQAVIAKPFIRPETKYITVFSGSDDLAAIKASIKNNKTAAFYFSASKLNLTGFGVCLEQGTAYYIPVGHTGLDSANQLSEKVASELLSTVFDNPDKEVLIYDLKTSAEILDSLGISAKAKCFDVMLAAYCINPSKQSYTMQDITLDYLKYYIKSLEQVTGTGKKQLSFEDIELSSASDFACANAAAVYPLAGILEEALKQNGLEKLFIDMETPLAFVLSNMEATGLKIDLPYFKELSNKFAVELSSIEKAAYSLAGQEFNLASPKQLSFILFEKLKLPAVKKTKTGFSTDEEVLNSLASSHELPKKLLEFREIQKLKTTYVDPLIEKYDQGTGRIHTSFNQTGTATGRLSSSDPNLQNIPIRTEYGREIRRGFIPEEGFSFLSADYSQIDLRVLAHISKDQILTQAFIENFDVHTATACEVFGKKPSEVTEDLRRAAKTINFGIVYGMSPFGLAQQLGISNAEAKQYIDTYFKRYSGVKEWIEQIIRDARRDGYVKTLLGRVRYLPEINSTNHQIKSFAERMAMNTPIQGTSADIIKVAMINIARHLNKEKSSSRLLVQVHDDLLFEMHAEESKTLPIMIKSDMETAVKLDVPVKVDMKTGNNWADMDKLRI